MCDACDVRDLWCSPAAKMAAGCTWQFICLIDDARRLREEAEKEGGKEGGSGGEGERGREGERERGKEGKRYKITELPLH